MTNELTRERYERLVPSRQRFTNDRTEFIEVGRRMMELEEQVYFSVISTPSGPNGRPCSVHEYHLSIDEPAFRGAFQLFGRNAQGKQVMVQNLFEVFEDRAEHDRELLETLVGAEKAAGLYWVTAHQEKVQEGQFSQARVYHLKGGEKQ